jgi:type I restriction enzyme S subunit
MGSKWQNVRLGDVVLEVIDNRGKTPPCVTNGEYELIEVNAISATNKFPQYRDVKKFVTRKIYETWFRKGHPKIGDILIPTVGTLGSVSYVNENRGCIAQNLIALRTKSDKCLGEYLYYHLCNSMERQRLLNLDIGGVQPSIKVPHLLDLEIIIPPLSTQRAIAATLSCLDDKIELNNCINANLEAQAQAIFESWFDSQGDKSWKYRKLSDIAMVNPQRNLKKGVHAPYLEMANLSTHGSFPSNWETKIFSGGMKFKNGDTILARITPCLENGKTAYINFMKEGEIGYGSTEYIVLSAKDSYPNEVLYFLARTEDFRNYAIKNMTGTSGRQRVSADIIERYKIKIPPKEVVDKYRALFNLYMSIIRENSFESRTLAAIRDALLPRLMSGEIEIKE